LLEGERVLLRDWRRSDVEAMYPVAGDVRLHALTSEDAWQPRSLEQTLQRYDKQLAEPDPTVVGFAVSRVDDPDRACLGSALVWGLNQHQRVAHLGLTLAEQARGQGLGTETVHLLCRYAFEVRDLVRVQVETLASNVAMQRAAEANGFVPEGRLRQNAWVMGGREDELLYGLLAEEWRARAAG
jgi:RimJ/RimL family protein N-acetyltransferase